MSEPIFMLKYTIRCMLLNSYKNETKNNLLIDKYIGFINSGVKPSEILVLVQNSTLKKNFVEHALNKIEINAF